MVTLQIPGAMLLDNQTRHAPRADIPVEQPPVWETGQESACQAFARQAWKTVLELLQNEMPKSNFDSWVRDTELLSCQDNLMTIGTCNSYARDWLESHLTSTVANILVGIMNRQMQVRFVVDRYLCSANPGEQGANEDNNNQPPESSGRQIDLHGAGQIWQALLGELQKGMPKASFDTWVRDACPISLTDTTLTIGVKNAYARDWLESRIAQTVTSLLAGLANDQVHVEFVVHSESQTVEILEDASSSLSIEPVDMTRYQNEVQPDRVVVIPGYALRLLEQGDLTPKEMSLWIGFRQAVYQRWKKGQGTLKHIPYWEAARFAMMSRASYFRELRNRTEMHGREYLAGGLVEVVPEPLDGGASLTGKARFDNANCYRVQMSPRLTRRDSAVLELILTAEASLADNKASAHALVLSVLNDLAARDPTEYLDHPVDVGNAWPRSLGEIVRRVIGLDGNLPEDLGDAAERVYDRILQAFGKVFITHYFLRVVVTALGLTHPQAWAIIMLRDRCWYDYETQSQKDFALVTGGLDSLANWVGVTRKAVTGWLQKPEFSAFVRMADLSLLDDIPDTWREKGVAVFLVYQQEPVLDAVLENKCDSGSEKVRLTPGKSETHSRKKCDSELEKVRLALGKSETRLNNFIKPLINPYKPQESPPLAERLPQNQPWVGNLAFWDFGFLMANNAVQPGSIRNLIKTSRGHRSGIKRLAEGFVSWLLYAYTSSGSRITDPVGLAVQRLQENRYAGPSPGLDRLAAMRPATLKVLFDACLAGERAAANSLEAKLFATEFGSLEHTRLRQLYRRLFG